ncbi:MAG TPA: DegV family protein [Candidatus Faecousia intestinavium]|nr:DegV family protein [Candidatus Faecousia intestinavium]
MSVRIIVDSTTDLPEQTARRVTVVPLTIHFGEQQYVSGVDIDARKFYEMLVEGDVLPTTSQPTPYAFTQVFQEAVDAGDTVVCITVSSKLSGTYQSACIAAADFPGKVFVVDSLTVAIGGGILTEYALSLTDKGMDAEEIAWKLMQKREKVRLLALLDTLEYLKKGGRISSAVAFAGGLLNIKPVIAVADGEVKMLGKARGSKQGNNLLVQEIDKAGGVDFEKPLLLGYTGLSDALLQKYIVDSAALWQGKVEQLPVSIVGSVVGTHAGPGAVAVAFFAAETE